MPSLPSILPCLPRWRRLSKWLAITALTVSPFASQCKAQTAWGVTGDVRVVGDFDGDGQLDYGIWRPSNGTWYVYQSSHPGAVVQQQWGLSGDIPVPADYDGDGKTDLAVWRPSNGTWYVIPTSTGIPYAQGLGLPGDISVPGDYDGDGKTDLAVWRPSNGTWYIILSGNPGNPFVYQWGLPGDVPVSGDFDGSGKQEMAVWRPSEGNWYIISAKTGVPFTKQWGLPGDTPVVADFDGDGVTDYAVWRPSDENLYVAPSSTGTPYTQQVSSPAALLSTRFNVGSLGKGVYVRVNGDYDGDGNLDFALYDLATGYWFIIPTSNVAAPITIQWGLPGDVPVPGDYDGDGRTDVAVWRPSEGNWYVVPSSTRLPYTQQWGLPGDMPVPGRYDVDSKTDFAVWRPSDGNWYVVPSGTGVPYVQQWGLTGDVPVAVDFDADGKTDLAVWRPSNGTWYVIPSSTGMPFAQQWGLPGDVPVAGDFDGDGKADFAVWRPSNGSDYIVPSNQPSVPEITQLGLAGDSEIFSQPQRTGLAATSLSNSSPIPLTLLYIGTTGLSSGAPVTLNFSNASGYSATVQALRVGSDGTVVAAVPLYANPDTAQIGPGTVSVVVTQGSQSIPPIALNIQDLPPVSSYGLQPGEATHAILVFDALLLARRINQLQAFQNLPGNTVDTTTAQSTLQTLLTATIEARHDVDQVIQDPSTVIQDETLPNGVVVQFDSNTLDVMDRVNANFLMQTFANLPIPSAAAAQVRPAAESGQAAQSLLKQIVAAIQTLDGAKEYTEGAEKYQQAQNWIDSTQASAQAATGTVDFLIGTGIQNDTVGTQSFGVVGAVLQNARVVGDAFAQDAAYVVGWATGNQALQQVAVEAMMDAEAANTSTLQDLILALAGGPTYAEALGDASTIASFVKTAFENEGPNENQADQTQIDVANETQYMPGSESQDLAYVDGIANISNPAGSAAAQTGIDVSSNGIELDTLGDSNGNYELVVPLQNSTFNYSNTYLEAYDPISDQILVSDTIDLSGLTSTNPIEVPTLTGSCSDGDDDEDDPDCDSIGQIRKSISTGKGSTTVAPATNAGRVSSVPVMKKHR